MSCPPRAKKAARADKPYCGRPGEHVRISRNRPSGRRDLADRACWPGRPRIPAATMAETRDREPQSPATAAPGQARHRIELPIGSAPSNAIRIVGTPARSVYWMPAGRFWDSLGFQSIFPSLPIIFLYSSLNLIRRLLRPGRFVLRRRRSRRSCDPQPASENTRAKQNDRRAKRYVQCDPPGI